MNSGDGSGEPPKAIGVNRPYHLLNVFTAPHENRLLEHQFAAQTTGSLVRLAPRDKAGHRVLTGNEMHGRAISSARSASCRLSLGLSRREVIQRSRHSCEA